MDRSVARVLTGTLLGYGAGQLGAQIFRDTPAVLLPIFMTTMLGVPAWLSGIVILIPKLWLIACDPLVGAWSDRQKAARGRTPFLLVGAILTSLSFLSFFLITDYRHPWLAAVAICVLFFIGSTAFSIFSVPYLAIASELSIDPHERTRILMVRMVFTTVGVLIGVGVAQPLVFALGGGAFGWHVMALGLAAVCLVTMLVPALALRRVVMLPGGATPGRLLGQLKPVLANRPYRVLLATCFVQGIGQASSYTVLGFVFLYALNAIWIVPAFIVVMVVFSGISQPLWLTLSRRWGKTRTYILSSVLWMLVTISWFFARPGDDVLVMLPLVGPLASEHVLILLRAVIIGLTNSGFLLLSLSLLTDTVDDQRTRYGVAHEGVFSGLFSAAEKLAFAMGPLIAGLVLSLYGFTSSIGGAAVQTPRAVTGILLLYSLVPAATQLLSLMIFSRFRLETHRPDAQAA